MYFWNEKYNINWKRNYGTGKIENFQRGKIFLTFFTLKKNPNFAQNFNFFCHPPLKIFKNDQKMHLSGKKWDDFVQKLI